MNTTRICAILLALGLWTAVLPAEDSRLSLMPMPASVSVSSGRMAIDSTFSVSTPNFSGQRLKSAITRMQQRLGARTGLLFPTAASGKLVVDVATEGMPVQGIEEDEGYSLEITPQQAMLKAATVVGAMHGLETFLQLVEASSGMFSVPLAKITDRPRFPWRGLLLDVSRHWQPPAAIKRTLDAMAVVKLNVFHWHLSDDQGFRVESLRFPRLHEMGSDHRYYTQAEIREILAYARDRGIRVLPEFDMPAHANPWFIGYPELGSLPGPYKFIHDYAVTTVNFDPTKESTYHFIDEFLGEMTQLFPDKYWHIGGDEVDGYSWDNNPHIQAFMKRNGLRDNAALQAYFNDRLGKLLRKHGRRMVGWDEIMHADLGKDIVVQSWQSSEALGNSARMGFDGFLSAPYYLDKMERTSKYYTADPSDRTLDAAQAARILGGEVCAWGELLSEDNLDSRLWPYSAAIAERFWSPQEVTDPEDMYRRLEIVGLHLEEAGSRHLANFEIMIRQASRGGAPDAVHRFFGLVEPLRLGAYRERRHITQLTPLVALGDIAVADPPAARCFASKLRAFLNGASQYHDDLVREFRAWQELKPALAALARSAPAFDDAEGPATDLADLGATGQEALTFLDRQITPLPAWAQRQATLLERAKIAKGVLRVAVVDAMQELVKAANSISH